MVSNNGFSHLDLLGGRRRFLVEEKRSGKEGTGEEVGKGGLGL